MNVWNIYHSDGSFLTDANGEQVRTSDIELSEAWMSECFVSVSFKHNAPIDFQIGDYLIYRNERYELNYEPGKDKSSSLNSYGDGFVYDSVKFNALQDELSRTEFLDVVLHDNELHYTALSKFSFYVETIDNLLDRIQANLDEQIGKGKWKIFSRSIEKSRQRGCTDEEWKLAYGEKTPDDIVIDSKSLTVDTQTCWDALALVQSEFNVNFIIRGRNIYVGTIGVVADHIFKYGLGEGLYEIEQNADSEQQVITRLRAYGSEKNLPSHYYTDLDKSIVAYVLSILGNRETEGDEVYTYVVLDLAFYKSYFTKPIDGQEYEVYITTDSVTNIRATIKEGAGSTNKGKCVLGVYWYEGGNPYNSTSKEDALKFINSVKVGDKIQLVSGINKDNIHAPNVEYADYLPNNMAVNRLMLPGFPKQSLSDFYNTLTEDEKKYVNPTGKAHKFSNDKYRPYVDSLNIDKIGLRSSSQFFDTDDKTNGVIEIYPTIEEMVVNGVRVDEINEGVTPDDDGRFEDNATVANVDIYLSPSIDFDINDLREDDFSISMKDGMCGGRTFKVASVLKENSRWRLRIERVKDEALELWFPYKDYPIRKGDHFVLTGIKLPDSYVRAASLKLLKYAIALLDKNDYTRYVYQPKVDEIFMARQHDMAMSDTTGLIKSFHDTLKAGDLLRFEDTDLGIDAEITIDQLVIKEAEGQIPTYEITLREDKEVGTIQKIQNQISSLLSGNAGTGGGLTVAQLRAEIASEGGKRFLSKFKDDTAQGLITFLKGLKSQGVIKAVNGMSLGNGENYVNGNGDANLSDVVVDRIHDKNSTPSDRVIIGAQGFDLYMGDDGKSHLYVDYLTARTRMFASSVEIRKVSYSGGTTIFSNAGSQIAKVSYIYDEAKEKVIAYKCYAVADDGTTKTMNWWHVGMMALCQTFNVKAGEDENLANRYYWRLVVGVGQEKIEEKLYDYVVLSNLQTFHGNDNVIPYSNTGAQFGNGFPIAFGATLVSTTGDMEMKSLAYIFQDQEGKTTDDSNTAIADRVFYGYETVDGDSEPDAPQAYDVIVQAGDQIEWKKYGNVIKLSTSTEDNATDNAPAITMYHKMGAPNATGDTDDNGNPVINPYLWRTVTAVISPEIVMYNTDIYKLFQGTPDNIVDPIVVIFDIIPSAQYITRHPVSRTTTPSNITFRVRRRTGNAVDYIDNAKIYACINGSEEGTLLSTKQLSDLGTIYDMNSVSLYATVNAVEAGKPYDKRVAELDIPVLTDGDKGIDGTDALEVTIKNAPVVFDTDSNGVVNSSAIHNAEIWVTRDGKNVIADIKNPSISVTDSLNFTVEGDNAVIRKTSECLQIALKGIGIAKEIVNGNAVSKTSGYVVVSFNDGTNMFQRQILFNINVSKFNSSVIQTAKLYEQQYTEVSNKYDALPEEVRNKKSFTEYNSAIKQTAREISLSVTEEAAKKRNLLVNSDFVRNCGVYFPRLASRAIVERLSGYEGENCVHTFASTVASIPALTWGGNGNTSPNIPVIIGKKYTISCWVKVSSLSSVLCIKVFKQQSLTDSVGTATMLDKQIVLDAKNTWQLVTTTFEASGDYSYASVSIFVRPTANSRVDSYICRPMLEQADSYNGWTLAEEDYVYRNGNMLDNTRYLNTGGNLITVGTIYNNVKDNCSMSEASVDMVTTERRTGTLLRYKLPLEAYTDYVLSFYIRSKDIDSKQNVICTIIQDSGVFFAEALMQKEKETVGILSNYTSLNGNTTTSGYVSFSSIPTEWTKVSYHFSLNTKNTAQSISILAYAQNGAGTLQICQPKLEKAVTNTAWTEAKQDVAFKDKYKRAGIDLDSETIRLSAERTIIDGDMYLKGILIENTAEPVKADFFPIVCDLKQNKSIAVGTYTGTENYGTGSENKFVVLPMFDDTSCINENGEETIVAGLKESGVKLSIFSKYNPNVAKWATAKRYRYLDTAEVWGMPPYRILHAAITVVYADPRIAFKKNYFDFTNASDGTTSVSATIKPQGDGSPSYNANQGYKHGCFVCNGRRGRMLLLMPGQTLHITSSIEKWNGENVLMWYIDNASEFVPVSKQVIFERDSNQKDYTYTWVNLGYTNSDQSNDSSFPGDFVNNDTNLVYEDVLFAPPQLSRDYPASDEWGMDKVQSGEALTIPLF